jgi:predicted ester cyclase
VTDPDIAAVRQVLERNIAAVNAQDVDAYVANQQPDVEFVLPGGVTVQGRDQVRQYAEAQWTAFPDAKIAFGMQVLSRDRAATEVIFTGTHTGPLQTPAGVVAPTGKSVTFTAASILQIKDGLVASEHLFFDQLELMTQLGLARSP